MQNYKKWFIIYYVTDVETLKEVAMIDINLYYMLFFRRDYPQLEAYVSEDLETLLEIESGKRTIKQKKAINILKQLEKSIYQGKINMNLLNKLKKIV